MALNPRLELRAEQRLALTPAQRLRLAVLRMSPAELADELSREAARNPFLLVEPRRVSTVAPTTDQYLAAPDAPFQDDLRRQIARKGLPRRIAALALALIGELRGDGFLDIDLQAFAAARGADPAVLAEALEVLQSCEPAGVGARDVAECLRLQLQDLGLDADQAAATVAQLPGFARQDWKAVGVALGLDSAGVQVRAQMLRHLNARPIAEVVAPAVSLLADLRLSRQPDGTRIVQPDDGARPRAGLDAAMVRRAATEGFAPELLDRARALLAALDQRGRTLARIGDWLAQKQAGFFETGPAGLVPATQSDLAADLGLHPSTISRALAGKAIDVDGRLWPLTVFFSTALPGADGEAVSARAVQRRIAELIAAEVPGRPLSDDAVAGLLREQGVDIARRTVAKYRQGLRIPPSSTRRRLVASRRGG